MYSRLTADVTLTLVRLVSLLRNGGLGSPWSTSSESRSSHPECPWARRPTYSDESHGTRHPRGKPALSLPKGGGPRQGELGSRFRGNDGCRGEAPPRPYGGFPLPALARTSFAACRPKALGRRAGMTRLSTRAAKNLVARGRSRGWAAPSFWRAGGWLGADLVWAQERRAVGRRLPLTVVFHCIRQRQGQVSGPGCGGSDATF
jgi:hypothetical protein